MINGTYKEISYWSAPRVTQLMVIHFNDKDMLPIEIRPLGDLHHQMVRDHIDRYLEVSLKKMLKIM